MNATTPRIFADLSPWFDARAKGEFSHGSIGFVPTMGALHDGHLSLLRRAREENDHVVLSIFVNPTQFDDPMDQMAYPRTLEADIKLAGGLVDAILTPEPAAIYPNAYRYRVIEIELSHAMEGAQRAGHFEGVLTVVMKLLNIVRPARAYFGRKDWQQLQLVRGMTAAFFIPVEIVECETVRDHDGLAMSSRNRRLSETARHRAAAFPQILAAAGNAAAARDRLTKEGFAVDYVEEREGIRLGAVRLEGVRLIDNVRI